VGKIEDIFAQQGITDKRHTTNNDDGIKATLDYMSQDFAGLIFTNLVDFDMLYGHRNDVEGYAKALEDFDAAIPALITSMKDDDMLIITADHGCDPTTPSTDHSREYIPILLYGRQIRSNVNIGVRSTYADIGATITDILKAGSLDNGRSFKNDIM
jgi:phosphopentomutase